MDHPGMDDGVRAMYAFTIYLRTEDMRYFEAFDLKSDVKVLVTLVDTRYLSLLYFIRRWINNIN